MASGVVLMHREDLQQVAPLWLHYSEARAGQAGGEAWLCVSRAIVKGRLQAGVRDWRALAWPHQPPP